MRPVSISQIADEVLKSVVADAHQKTASAEAQKKPVYTVDAAIALRKLAEELRAEDDMPVEGDVSMEDIGALDEDPEVQELLMLLEQNPELLQQILAEEAGEGPPNAAEQAPPDAIPEEEEAGPPVKKDKDPEISPDLPKQASADLRKLASTLRKIAVADKAKRAVKAAAAFHAAKGIQYLVGGAR